jgi:DNA-binding MarR family transcriptional regulator
MQKKPRKSPAAGTARAGAAGVRRRASAQKPAVIEANYWLDDFVPYQLYRVTNKLNARLLTRLKKMRINASQWRVLSVLRAYGPMSIGRIVETTLMEQPTTSRVVAQLEGLGHVQRRLSDRDSRVAEISITAAGLEAFESIVPAALKHQSRAFENTSPKELALFVDILKKVERNIAPED